MALLYPKVRSNPLKATAFWFQETKDKYTGHKSRS